MHVFVFTQVKGYTALKNQLNQVSLSRPLGIDGESVKQDFLLEEQNVLFLFV